MRAYVELIAGVLYVALSFGASAATVWTGPTTTFYKTGAQDPNVVQDMLTSSVSLTRGGLGFLYNPVAGETSGDPLNFPNAPAGTEWAFAGLDGNPVGPAFDASNFAALNFNTFLNALGGPGPPGGGGAGSGIGNVILNQPGVVHLIADDIYFGIEFTQWTNAIGGSIVEYSRATVVPLPAALPFVGVAIGFGFMGRRRRLTDPPTRD